jgi:V/A-type H+/Na+-transporting ATPase subunit I
MRYDVKKVLFVGVHEESHAFFKKAQQVGIIHFIHPLSTATKELPMDLQRILSAIKVLRGLPPLTQEGNGDLSFADEVVDKIIHLKETLERLAETKRILNLEIARVEVFGNFSLEDIDFIEREGQCRVQFFVGKSGIFEASPLPEGLLFVATENNLDYFVAINETTMAYDHLIEMKIEHSLATLRERLQATNAEYVSTETSLKACVVYNEVLHHALAAKMNKYHLHQAIGCSQTALGGDLFAVEGWVPVNKMDQLDDIVSAHRIHYEEVAIEPTDAVPTCLENSGFGAIGEDLVHIYDTPSSTDKDPSLWVLWSFSLFFAFIINDGGYGLIFLAMSLYLSYRFSKTKGLSKRVLKLVSILSISCVLWGFMTTSFFSVKIDIDNPIRKISLTSWLVEKKAAYLMTHPESKSYQDWVRDFPELASATSPAEFINSGATINNGVTEYDLHNWLTDNIMLELALFIGIVHIILSFLRYIRRNWNGIGWIAFIIGGYLYFPYYFEAPSFLNFIGGIDFEAGAQLGYQLMIGGIVIAVAIAIIRSGWTGILELTAVIQVFADIVSYLRLYALGLAGGIVASTINEMADTLPFVVATLLIIAAHVVNMLLGLMSGVIHGLRLNFLEWYHYSFEGGGKPFRPLTLLKK